MSIYFAVVAAGAILFVIAVAALSWLVNSGQLDDLDTPALRMLHDDVGNQVPPSCHTASTAPVAKEQARV